MSDARLRDLERRAAEGDPSAQSALVVERLRTGALPSARGPLLAFCGHPVAEHLPEAAAPPTELRAWCRELAARFGKIAASVAGSGVARAAAERAPSETAGVAGISDDSLVTRALHALDLWRVHGDTSLDALRRAQREALVRGQHYLSALEGRLPARERVDQCARGLAFLATAEACALPVAKQPPDSALSPGAAVGRHLARAIAAAALGRASLPTAAEARRRIEAFPEFDPPPGDLKGAWQSARDAVIAWAATPVSAEPSAAVARLQQAFLRGQLSGRQVELAAYLGLPAASESLRARVNAPEPLVEWVDGLSHFGPDVPVRAALRLVRQHLLALAIDADAPEHAALVATEVWLEEPTRANSRALLDLVDEAPLDLAVERLALAAGSAAKAQTRSYTAAAARWVLAWRACERARLDPLFPTARKLDRIMARAVRDKTPPTQDELAPFGLQSLPTLDAPLKRLVADALLEDLFPDFS